MRFESNRAPRKNEKEHHATRDHPSLREASPGEGGGEQRRDKKAQRAKATMTSHRGTEKYINEVNIFTPLKPTRHQPTPAHPGGAGPGRAPRENRETTEALASLTTPVL